MVTLHKIKFTNMSYKVRQIHELEDYVNACILIYVHVWLGMSDCELDQRHCFFLKRWKMEENFQVSSTEHKY